MFRLDHLSLDKHLSITGRQGYVVPRTQTIVLMVIEITVLEKITKIAKQGNRDGGGGSLGTWAV